MAVFVTDPSNLATRLQAVPFLHSGPGLWRVRYQNCHKIITDQLKLTRFEMFNSEMNCASIDVNIKLQLLHMEKTTMFEQQGLVSLRVPLCLGLMNPNRSWQKSHFHSIRKTKNALANGAISCPKFVRKVELRSEMSHLIQKSPLCNFCFWGSCVPRPTALWFEVAQTSVFQESKENFTSFLMV